MKGMFVDSGLYYNMLEAIQMLDKVLTLSSVSTMSWMFGSKKKKKTLEKWDELCKVTECIPGMKYIFSYPSLCLFLLIYALLMNYTLDM